MSGSPHSVQRIGIALTYAAMPIPWTSSEMLILAAIVPTGLTAAPGRRRAAGAGAETAKDSPA